MRAAIFCLASLLFGGLSLHAQQGSQDQAASVEVRASPNRPLPNERVTISGNTDIDASAPEVKIEVTNVTTKSTAILAARADTDGNFSTVFGKTAEAGVYRVVAHSPSGRGVGTTEFTVASATVRMADINGEVQSDLDEARKTLDQLAQIVPTLPESPPRREMEQRMATLRQRMHELDQRMPAVIDAFDKFATMLDKAPDTRAHLESYTRRLRDWNDRSREQRSHAPELSAANSLCEQLERLNEGLNWMSLLFDLIGSPEAVLLDIFNDFVAADWVSDFLDVQSPEGKFAIGQFLKAIPSGERAANQYALRETVELEGTITDFVGDLSQFVVQKWFGMSCERFTGTFSAAMTAQFFSNMKMWWAYHLDIAGILDLRYPKNTPPGKPVTMTGEFQGVATRYTVWEDAIRVLYPKLAGSTLLYQNHRVPIGTPFHPAEMTLGKVAFNLLPNSFHIPVTAVYDGDTIIVHLQAAATDIDERARVVYVFLSPLALVPVVSSAELPYKDAHFILDRSTEGGIFTLPVTSADGKLFIAARQISHTSINSGAARGKYDLKIEICNPGCP